MLNKVIIFVSSVGKRMKQYFTKWAAIVVEVQTRNGNQLPIYRFHSIDIITHKVHAQEAKLIPILKSGFTKRNSLY